MTTYKKLTRELKLSAIKDGAQPAIKVTRSADAVQYARKFYFDDLCIYESFFIILLNNANNTIGWAKISQGGVTGTMVDRKLICKYAVDSLASGVICVHNHPSGTLRPSTQDIDVCKKVAAALGVLDIRLVDNIILTEDSYYSFMDNGVM